MRPCRGSRSTRPGAWAVALALALCAAGPLLPRVCLRAAHAQPAGPRPLQDARARTLFDRGLRLYQDKDFIAAAAQIEAAYNIEPRPDLLYMWAQTRRLGGDCAGAADLYRRFIATAPPATEIDRARKNLERCEPAPGAAPVPGVPGGPMATTPVAPIDSPIVILPLTMPPAAPPPETLRTPWRKDKLGHIFVASGVVTGAVGFGLYQWARAAQDTAASAGNYQDADRASRKVDLRQRLALGAAVLGTSLIIAGVVRYLNH